MICTFKNISHTSGTVCIGIENAAGMILYLAIRVGCLTKNLKALLYVQRIEILLVYSGSRQRNASIHYMGIPRERLTEVCQKKSWKDGKFSFA